MKHPDPRGDDLGDRVKALEAVETQRRLPADRPIIIRLDGRAFHTFARGCERPFDAGLRTLMTETTRACAEETNALLAYTQSDEISLVLGPIVDGGNQSYFGGRVQKIMSCLAARASVVFNALMPAHLPHKSSLKLGSLPVFDCRVWSVPDEAAAVEAILWREIDARVNAVSQIAHAHLSHKEMEGRPTQELKVMLEARGVDVRTFPVNYRRGVYLQRRRVVRAFTADEIEELPAKHAARTNPALTVERAELRELNMPPLAHVLNAADVFFRGAEPEAAPAPVNAPEAVAILGDEP